MDATSYEELLESIEEKTDYSHNAKDALDLLISDEWSPTNSIKRKSFDDQRNYYLPPRRHPLKDQYSPRQRIALESIRKTLLPPLALAYHLGRRTRTGTYDSLIETAVNPLQAPRLDAYFTINPLVLNEEQACSLVAYEKLYPLSSILDRTFGIITGVITMPIAFLTGILYTPNKK